MLEKKTLNSQKIFNAIKLVGAVLILYFGLKLGVGNIGENVDFLAGKYYEDISISSISYSSEWANELEVHNVSEVEHTERIDTYSDLDGEDHEYELKYQTLCFANFDFCMKIVYVGDMSAKDKFMYLASTIYVLNTIYENIQIGEDIKTQLEKITINTAYGATRGSADRSSVKINLGAVESHTEYLGLITHELGHVVDLGIIQGYSAEKDLDYTEFGKRVFAIDDPSLMYYSLSWDSESVRKSGAKKEDFCSGYGMTDPFEDFAECHNVYLNHNDIFKSWARTNEIMKQKYNFFANLYGGKYLFGSNSDMVKFENNPSWRPWDTTRM